MRHVKWLLESKPLSPCLMTWVSVLEPQGRTRELSPESCPLTFTTAHTYTQIEMHVIQRIILKEKVDGPRDLPRKPMCVQSRKG